jgi:glycolate oxidase FAD binding subunit
MYPLKTMTHFTITTVEQLQDVVRSGVSLLPVGGGSKSGLSAAPEGVTTLDLRGLSGIVEYEPDEFTFTALAGTPIGEVATALAEHGQSLPFDPPLVEHGATLGGAVASGLNGPGRQRYGGVRDFLIGVRFVDGQGRVVRGGGKVVKNAAGFDLPKLMVGSLGRLGVLTEVSFKVFPGPATFGTLCARFASATDLHAALTKLTCATFDIEALDAAPQEAVLWVRMGGFSATLHERLEQLRAFLGVGDAIAENEERVFWRDQREFSWLPAGSALVKTPTNLRTLPALEAALTAAGAIWRCSAGGNVTWIAWPGELAALDDLLTRLSLSGLVALGNPASPLIGAQTGGLFLRRIKRALDPQNKFLSFD